VYLALRKESLVFVVTMIVVNAGIMIWMMQSSPVVIMAVYIILYIIWAKVLGLLFVFLGFFLPFGVWKSDEPSHRAYHWAMPVPHGLHTLTRVLVGWCWLVAAILIGVACWLGLEMVVRSALQPQFPQITSRFATHAWISIWLYPFVAAICVYLLMSLVLIASEHPWRWVGGCVLAYIVAWGFHELAGVGIWDMPWQLFRGRYGVLRTVLGFIDVTLTRSPGSMEATQITIKEAQESLFDLSVLVWLLVALGGVVLVAYRRRET
jgi:hypothetical protein